MMRRKTRAPRISAALLLVSGALIYLVFHALNGNHGLYAYLKEQHKLEMQQIKLAELTEEQEELEQRVMYLSDDSLDLDLLDERARDVLGYSNPKERVVVISPENN